MPFERCGLEDRHEWIRFGESELRAKGNVHEDDETLLSSLADPSITGQALQLEWNILTVAKAAALARAVGSNPALRALKVSFDRSDRIAEVFRAFKDGLLENRTIVSLGFTVSLPNVQQTGASFAHLAELLDRNEALQDLSVLGVETLSLDEEVDPGFMRFCSSLARNTTLRSLLLGMQCLQPPDVALLFWVLEKFNKTLQTLNLPDAIYFPSRIYDYSTCIVRMLGSNSTLVELDLSGNGITDSSASDIANVLQPRWFDRCIMQRQGNSTLQRLDLSNNQIGEMSALAILKSRQRNAIPWRVNLTNNTVAVPWLRRQLKNMDAEHLLALEKTMSTATLLPRDLVKIVAGFISDGKWLDDAYDAIVER